MGLIMPVPGSFVAPGITHAVPGDSRRFSGLEWSVIE
jgi:hypothetical protein